VLAAGRQGKFWAMFDALVEHEGPLGKSDFVAYASKLGIDAERFGKDLDDPALAKQIEADVALADRVGVNGTPGFFVNGRYHSGFSPGVITSMVEEEQALGQQHVDAGIPRHQVVDTIMQGAVPEAEFPNR
jgi:protein-disulfide isomerase